MINLHERMLPTSGVEPATSWSPVGRRIQLSHRGRQILSENEPQYQKMYFIMCAPSNDDDDYDDYGLVFYIPFNIINPCPAE